MTSPGGAAGRSRVWWLSPVTVTLVVVPLATLSTAAIGDAAFRLQWRTPKTITVEQCLLLLSGGLVLALGAALVASARPLRPVSDWPALTPATRRVLERACDIFFGLTMIGYAAFVVAGARAGISAGEIADAFGSEGVYDSPIKEKLGTIPGITTLTQMGIATVVVASLLLAHRRTRRPLVELVAVLALALPRAFLLTERLAILELVVPMVVVLAMRASAGPRGRTLVAAVPAVFGPFVLAIFSAFEYSRSWVYFREHSTAPFWQFAVERLIGYYATSLNNGALEMIYNTYPGRWPHEILGAFWSAPGVDNLHLYQQLTGHDNETFYFEILQQHGTQEFNNSSGLAAPFVDLGPAGGLIYLLIAGIVLGLLYRSFLEARPYGVLIYPVVFIGVVELPRYLAWSQGRIFPAVVGLVVLAAVLRRSREPAARPEPVLVSS